MTGSGRFGSKTEVEAFIERRASGRLLDEDPDLTDAELRTVAREVGVADAQVEAAVRAGRKNPSRHETIHVEHRVQGVSVHISAPSITWYIAGRLVLYSCSVAFIAIALVSSDFSLVGWIATMPFFVMSIGALIRTVVLARRTVRVDIDRNGCGVYASAFGLKWSIVGAAAKTFAKGPLAGGSPGLRPFVFRLPFLRIVNETSDIDICHGLSERDIRRILKAIAPFIGGIEERE